MNDDPIMTIEAYLGHVREHLPKSMADEVIAELRGYMIEMAEDLGDGAVTSVSAKKVVARFGAPSEVAREYALSTSDLTESVIAVHRDQQQLIEELRPQQRELSPASYTGTFFKFIVIAVLWLVISWTVITPFAYWWMSTVSIITPVIQLGVLATAFAVILLGSKMRGLKLRNAVFSNWSSFQKLVTFPENLAVEAYSTKVLADIGLTILAVFVFALASSYLFPFFALFFAGPTILLMMAHLVFAIRRFGTSDPVLFIRQEYAVNIAILLFLNVVIAWGVYPWGNPIASPLLISYSVGYSTLILYQIIIRAQDLWWETARISDETSAKTPQLSPAEKRKLLSETKWTSLRTVGGISATFIGILLGGFSILILANNGIPSNFWYTQWMIIVIMVSFFGVVSVTIASVYFAVRYFLVRSGRRSAVLGKRLRIEAAVDSIITVAGFLLVIMRWPFLAGELISEVLSLISGTSPQFMLVLAAAISTWPLCLLLAIVVRIAADFRDLKERDSDFALEAMDFSGNLFAVQAAIMTGIFLSLLGTLDPFSLILNEVFMITMFSYAAMVLFAFQKSTCRTKLKWREEPA
ncbi:MAG: hypothetical protein ACFFER_01730 [Candidatus Thorarchaeota archaeon]